MIRLKLVLFVIALLTSASLAFGDIDNEPTEKPETQNIECPDGSLPYCAKIVDLTCEEWVCVEIPN